MYPPTLQTVHKIQKALTYRIWTKASDTILQHFVQTANVRIGGHSLLLDLRWPHERDYYRYYKYGYLNSALAFDVFGFMRYLRSGDVVLDAGANIGFTAVLALLFGADHVIAVEPDPETSARLQNLAGNDITVVPKALGEAPGRVSLRASNAHNQGATIEPRMVELFPRMFGSSTVDVEATTVDKLLAGSPVDFAKIDVEGAEGALLAGARETLLRRRPRVVLVEVYDEFFHEVHSTLSHYYSRNARLIFNQSQKCVEEIDIRESPPRDGTIFVNPPTYVYRY